MVVILGQLNLLVLVQRLGHIMVLRALGHFEREYPSCEVMVSFTQIIPSIRAVSLG